MAFVVLCGIIVPVACALSLAVTLQESGERVESCIRFSLSRSLSQHQAIRPSNVWLDDIAESLNANEALRRWAGGAASEQEARALEEELAQASESASLSTGKEQGISLYSSATDAFLGSLQVAASETRRIIADNLLSNPPEAGKRATMLQNDGSRDVAMLYAWEPGIYLIIQSSGSTQALDEIIESIRAIDDQAQIGFFDQFGTLDVFSPESFVLESIDPREFTAKDEVASVSTEVNGTPYLCLYLSYLDANTTFVVAVEDGAVLARREAVTVAIAGLLGALALFSCAVFYFVSRIYRPMNQVMDALPQGDDSSFDEMESIRNGVLELREQKEARGEALRCAQLLSLLRGQTAILTDAEEEPAVSWGRDNARYALVVAIQSEGAVGSAERMDTAGLCERERERLAPRLRELGFDGMESFSDGLLDLTVIFWDECDEPPLSGIVKACEALKLDECRGEGCTCSVFVSEWVRYPFGLQTAYDQVVSLSHFALSSERYGVVLCYGRMKGSLEAFNRLQSFKIKELLDALSDSSPDRALAAFDDAVRQQGLLDKDTLQGDPRFAYLENTLHLGLLSACTTKAQQMEVERRLNQGLARAKTVKDIRGLLQDMVVSRPDEQATDPESRFSSLEEFVLQHLSDQNLSGQMVANAFGISPSNVSRIFTVATGQGFLSYIHEARLAHAKTLLVETTLSLQEIAETVGFGNALTMSRAFKKRCGMTPGAYRKTGGAGRTKEVAQEGSWR